MSASTNWADLAPRVGSAMLLIAVGGGMLYVGGWPFWIMVWTLCGVMIWELARMHGSAAPVGAGLIASVALALAHILPAFVLTAYVVPPLLLAGVLTGAAQVTRDKGLYLLYGLLVIGGCYAMLIVRDLAGLGWVVWLVLVVVASDVAGYFAGRMMGGPKFWPRISPKKTWSGTVAGWIAAGVIGLAFSGVSGVGAPMIILATLTALAGQLGDIAESAVKRRAGVKDSSALIPGHGGVLDRFDAMLAACALVFLLMLFGIVPGVR